MELASSTSSLDICVASTAKIDEARAKFMSAAAEREELGERIAEVSVCTHSSAILEGV